MGEFNLFLRSHQGELTSRPAAYKAAALPTELWCRLEGMGRCGKSVLRGPRPNSRQRISFLGIMAQALFKQPNLRGIARPVFPAHTPLPSSPFWCTPPVTTA